MCAHASGALPSLEVKFDDFGRRLRSDGGGAVEALHNLEFSIILSPRQQRPRRYQLPRYS